MSAVTSRVAGSAEEALSKDKQKCNVSYSTLVDFAQDYIKKTRDKDYIVRVWESAEVGTTVKDEACLAAAMLHIQRAGGVTDESAFVVNFVNNWRPSVTMPGGEVVNLGQFPQNQSLVDSRLRSLEVLNNCMFRLWAAHEAYAQVDAAEFGVDKESQQRVIAAERTAFCAKLIKQCRDLVWREAAAAKHVPPEVLAFVEGVPEGTALVDAAPEKELLLAAVKPCNQRMYTMQELQLPQTLLELRSGAAALHPYALANLAKLRGDETAVSQLYMFSAIKLGQERGKAVSEVPEGMDVPKDGMTAADFENRQENARGTARQAIAHAFRFPAHPKTRMLEAPFAAYLHERFRVAFRADGYASYDGIAHGTPISEEACSAVQRDLYNPQTEDAMARAAAAKGAVPPDRNAPKPLGEWLKSAGAPETPNMEADAYKKYQERGDMVEQCSMLSRTYPDLWRSLNSECKQKPAEPKWLRDACAAQGATPTAVLREPTDRQNKKAKLLSKGTISVELPRLLYEDGRTPEEQRAEDERNKKEKEERKRREAEEESLLTPMQLVARRMEKRRSVIVEKPDDIPGKKDVMATGQLGMFGRELNARVDKKEKLAAEMAKVVLTPDILALAKASL